MGYAIGHKANWARMGLSRPTVGGGNGLMVNPRAPGARVGLLFPQFAGNPAMRARVGGMWPQPYRGDPGFFGAIGKALGKVAKGVVSTVAHLNPVTGKLYDAASAALSSGGSTRIGAPASRTLGFTGGGNPGIIPPNPFGQMDISGGSGGGGGTEVTVATAGGGTAVARCAPSGYHLNKSAYWRNESDLVPGATYIEKGTVLVKNRRQNPFNPRAASRAMNRLGSLYKAMKVLDKQMRKVAHQAGVKSAPRHHRAPRRAK